MLLVLGLLLIVGGPRPTQIDPARFLKEHADDATRLDVHNHTVYATMGNRTQPSWLLQLEDRASFKDALQKHNFTGDYMLRAPPAPLASLGPASTVLLLLMASAFARRLSGSSRCSCICTEEKVSARFSDVAGLAANKRDAAELVDFVKNRDKYTAIGARMPRGAVFYGPPGTGKTLLAKAIAGECDVPFISAAGPDFSELYVGVGAARVRDLFKKARKKAPCIVFIDEVDALARARGALSLSNSERDSTLNRLLIELDGFSSEAGILVLVATNRLDILDKAFLRAGRFDRKLKFALPERCERQEIFAKHLSRIGLIDEPAVCAAALAKRALGLSGADIACICNEGAILAVRRGREKACIKDLEDALDRKCMGEESTTYTMSDREKRTVAYHEAGHAVVAHLRDGADPPIKVSIVPRTNGALGFSQSEVNDSKLKSREELLDKIAVLLGGRVAEEIFCDTITTGASDDLEKAASLALRYITIYGMDREFGAFFSHTKHGECSEGLRAESEAAARRLIAGQKVIVRAQVEKHAATVKRLAEALLEEETLGTEALARLLD